VFARQFSSTNQTTPIPPLSFQDAQPVAELIKTVTLPPRLIVSKVTFTDPSVNLGAEVTDGAFGFFSNFTIGSGNSGAGTQNTMLVPIPILTSDYTGFDTDTAYAPPLPTGVTHGIPYNIFYMSNSGTTVNESGATGTFTSTAIDPSSGVRICLQDQDKPSQYAIVTVGGNGSAGTLLGNPLSVQLSTGNSCP